jgi:hypothetical protein
MNYFTGRVYKIQIKDEFKKSQNMLTLEQEEMLDCIYIGSTKNSLKTRFKHHKSLNKNRCATKILVELFDRKNVAISLIKEYSVIDEKHLYMYESLHMNKFRLNNVKLLNKQASFRIEIYASKDYRLKHLEEKKEINKEYYSKNKDYFDTHNSNYYKANKQNYHCEICDYYFICESYLNNHKETKAHKVKCHEIQPDKYEEYKENKYSYSCDKCNIYSNDKKIFVKHIKSKEHTDLKLSTEEENKIYIFRFNCEPCNFKDDSKKDYETHLLSKKHKEVFNIQEEFKYKCEPCRYYQNQEKLFNRHLKSKRHAELAGEYCEMCKFTPTENISMKYHIISDIHKLEELKKTNNEEEFKYKCGTCSIYSNNRLKFSIHLKSKEHIVNIEESKEIKEFVFKYSCLACSFFSEEKKDMTRM